MPHTTTKKIKNNPLHNKKELWDMFDKSIKDSDEPIECVYDKKENTDCCNVCESPLYHTDEGFMCCSNDKCGVLYTNVVDQNAEWRYYGADDNGGMDPTRCGMPINPLLEESSYGCKVLSGSNSYEMRKLRRYTEWQSMPYKEKAQWDEFQKITIMAQNNNIPKIIIDEAIRYHKKISEQKTFRGLNRTGIIAASIYIACSLNKYPRTAKEIATIFNLDNTSATKGCKNAISIINSIETDVNNEQKTVLTHATPMIFIDRFCSKLSINDELTRLCKFIAQKVERQNIIPENTPPSIAVGIIYYVCIRCNLNITKKTIYNATQVSEVTINKCSQKLLQSETEFIPSVIVKKYNN